MTWVRLAWFIAIIITFGLVVLLLAALSSDSLRQWSMNNERAAYTIGGVILTTILAGVSFVYNQLSERVKELGEDLKKQREKFDTIRQDLNKSVEEAQAAARNAGREAIENVQSRIDSIEHKVETFEQEHPWLRELDRDFIAIYSDNLDAIFVHAVEMYQRGQINPLAQWLRHVIEPKSNDDAPSRFPSYNGSPESFMYMAEFVLDALNDASLAEKIIARHKELNRDKNKALRDTVDSSLHGSTHAGVVAVELEIMRRTGQIEKGRILSVLLDAHLTGNPIDVYVLSPLANYFPFKRFAGWQIFRSPKKYKVELDQLPFDWREEVYLARYYFALGGNENQEKANLLLRKSWREIPRRESKSELYYAAADIANTLGNIAQAVPLAEEAIYADVSNLRAHALLAEIHLSAGKFEEAAVIAQNAERIAPRSHLHLAARNRLRKIVEAYAGNRVPPKSPASPERERRAWTVFKDESEGVQRRTPDAPNYDDLPSSAFVTQLQERDPNSDVTKVRQPLRTASPMISAVRNADEIEDAEEMEDEEDAS